MKGPKTQTRYLLQHEFDMGHTAYEAWRNLCVTMGENAPCYATTKNWFNRFIQNQRELVDKQRPQRRPDIDLTAVNAAIEADPSLSTRMLAVDFHCSHTQIASILKKLGKKLRHGKWVPHELTQNQKNSRLAAAQQLLKRFEQEDFLDRIITADEKWVSFKNPVNKKQYLSRGQPANKVPKPDFRQKRVLLSVFWWKGGIIHWETIPTGQTINSHLYCQQLDRVQQKIRSPGLSGHFRRGVIFQQDNATPHVANMTLQKLNQLGWERLIHPAYSPDCAPSDYHLFASLSHSLAGKNFVNFDHVKKHLHSYFASKALTFYARGINLLPEKWQLVVDHNGDYFEN